MNELSLDVKVDTEYDYQLFGRTASGKEVPVTGGSLDSTSQDQVTMTPISADTFTIKPSTTAVAGTTLRLTGSVTFNTPGTLQFAITFNFLPVGGSDEQPVSVAGRVIAQRPITPSTGKVGPTGFSFKK